MFPPAGWTTVTATLVRRNVATATDDYGNDILETVEIPLPGCIVWPRELSQENGSQVISGVWLLGPLDEVIDQDDAVRVEGVTYEVEGNPGEFRSPFDAVNLQQVALRRVTG